MVIVLSIGKPLTEDHFETGLLPCILSSAELPSRKGSLCNAEKIKYRFEANILANLNSFLFIHVGLNMCGFFFITNKNVLNFEHLGSFGLVHTYHF